MEGSKTGKVKKTRSRKKPYDKKQNGTTAIAAPTDESNTIPPGNISDVAIDTTGNIGKVTVDTTTGNEEENSLLKIVRYVAYKVFEKSVNYCDGCKRHFGDIATRIICDQSLEMYNKNVNQGIQEGICHKYDCFVGNTLQFILYYFPAACNDVAYAKYGNEMSEIDDLLLDKMRDFVLSYRSCANPFAGSSDSKH